MKPPHPITPSLFPVHIYKRVQRHISSPTIPKRWRLLASNQEFLHDKHHTSPPPLPMPSPAKIEPPRAIKRALRGWRVSRDKALGHRQLAEKRAWPIASHPPIPDAIYDVYNSAIKLSLTQELSIHLLSSLFSRYSPNYGED